MTLDMDFSVSYLEWDLTEAVTFTSVATVGAEQSFPVDSALQGQPSAKERAPSGGVYAGSDLQWLLPGPLLRGLTVKPGDVVTPADGTAYTVLQPGYDQLDQVWQCYAVALSIAHQLADRVSLWSPTNLQDAAGSRLPRFVQAAGPYDARIQPTGAQEVQERGKTLWQRTYDVFLAAELDATGEDQLRDGAGNVYQVVSVRNRSRIDELSVVTVTRVLG